LNATQAAIRVGFAPKAAAQQASRLLTKAKVCAYRDRLLAEASKRSGVSIDRVLRELGRLAFVNPRDVINFKDATINTGANEDDLAAVASVKVKEFPTPAGMGVEREIRLYDKTRSLELAGKYLKMFTDKVESNEHVSVIFVDDLKDDNNNQPAANGC